MMKRAPKHLLFWLMIFVLLLLSSCKSADTTLPGAQSPVESSPAVSESTMPSSTPTPKPTPTPLVCDHEEVIDPAVKPTCEKAGKTAGSHCKKCGEILKKQEPVNAHGHTFKDATCDLPKTCALCGKISGSALGHNYAAGKCTVCGGQKPSEGLQLGINGGNAFVIGLGSCKDKHVVIPSSYNGKPVVSVNGFYNSNIESVTLPKSVATIGEGAFENCKSLKKVVFEGAVSSVGAHAFEGCSTLERIAFSEGLTSIGAWSFRSCEGLKEVTFPESLRTIGEHAFELCISLKSVSVPKKVTVIADYAFSGCSSLMSLTLQEGLKTIGSDAFGGCEALASLTLPESLTSIGNSAFARSALTELNVPAGVKTIGDGAFAGSASLKKVTLHEGLVTFGGFGRCAALESIEIPSTVKKIGYEALAECTEIKTLTLPSGLEEIGARAFAKMNGLASIVIPKSVKRIDGYAFGECRNLQSIFCEAERQPVDFESNWAPGISDKVYFSNDWHYVESVPTLKK